MPARFGNFPVADTFYNIIAVSEILGNTYEFYYLLKDGRKVGQDSVYMFDFTPDCESEGKIIFKDRKKDRVGYLDKSGTPIIPAIYNYVSPFRNGFAIALRNAKRKCREEGGDTTNCEHLGWEGGEIVLINDKNEILAANVSLGQRHLDWYSARVNDPLIDTSMYRTITGKKGYTYSFIDFDKEFKIWFNNMFLPALKGSIHNLQDMLFDEVTGWSEENGWTALEKNTFLRTFPAVLTSGRFEANKVKDISISQDLFNIFIFDKGIYRKYMNACGEHNKDKFPLYRVVVTNYKKRQNPGPGNHSIFLKTHEIDYQEYFDFLKTEKGYRLLSVSVAK